MKTRRVIILLIALGLIVFLEAMLIARCSRPDAVPAPMVTAEPAETPAPEITAPPATVPDYTRPPQTIPPVTEPPATPTPTAVPTPTPTAEPTPTPAPEVDTLAGAGSFGSDTGTSLNLGVSWSAVDHGDGTTTITINGSVTSYSLQLGATSVSIDFEGYSVSVTGNSINADGSSLVTNGLFSTTMTVPSGMAGTMTVAWGYNGSYEETDLGTVIASGFVYTD